MQWKTIEDFPNYQISDQGLIWSNFSKRFIKQFDNSKGYLMVTLCKDGNSKKKTVHFLVALTFIPNPDQKPQINHKDLNKCNNSVDNLEWCTNSENQIHSYLNDPIRVRLFGNQYAKK
jgi:hypothetical protein